MNAKLDIKIGVQTRRRFVDEPFKPTRTWSSDWHWESDLAGYSSVVSDIASEVFSYVQSERSVSYTETTTHVAVRLDNPTHPIPSAGVVPLAKGHRDCTFTDGNLTSSDDLLKVLNDVIADLQKNAKY